MGNFLSAIALQPHGTAGLSVGVLRPAGGGSSNGGVTETHDTFVLTWDTVFGTQVPIFEPSPRSPHLHLTCFTGRHMVAVPVDDPRMHDGLHCGPMFGGCFVYSSDSRFPAEYPIPVHDRFETQELSDTLSQ